MVVGPYSGGAGMIFDALLASDLPLGDNPFAGGTGGGVTPTITWANPAPIVYGTALSGVQLNATASAPGVASVPGTFTYAPAAGAVLNAGNAQTLSVTFTPTDPVAYNPVTKPVSLNVSQKALTIAAGPNQTKVYGAANPTFNPLVYTGFVNGDTPASLDTAATVGTTATASSPVGTYPITVSGAVDVNYLITFVNGTLTVNQAPLSITADNKTRLYGAANPAPTLSYSGFVNGDTVASLDTAATAGTTATPASPVGTYPITVSGAADVNYAITFVNGALLVGRAPLTITADNKTKVYGAANPAPTLSYSGFVNGETAAVLDTAATVGTTATPASPVGTYPITVSGAVDANYAIAFVNGLLSVGRAPLTITADNKTRPVGAANPTFTASYAGFVNGDTPASLDTPVSFSTTAATGSPAGTYPITPLGAVDVNYTIAFVAGTLTVTPVAATTPVLTWADPAPIVYGTALSGVQLNATASAPGVAVVPGTFAYTPGAGAVLNAGVGQTLSVTFTPTDLATYLPATR